MAKTETYSAQNLESVSSSVSYEYKHKGDNYWYNESFSTDLTLPSSGTFQISSFPKYSKIQSCKIDYIYTAYGQNSNKRTFTLELKDNSSDYYSETIDIGNTNYTDFSKTYILKESELQNLNSFKPSSLILVISTDANLTRPTATGTPNETRTFYHSFSVTLSSFYITITYSSGVVHYWNGSQWVEGELKYWNGTEWVDGAELKYWNGTAWVEVE